MEPTLDDAGFAQSLEKVKRVLLDTRTTDGHWEGELSGSALSTATALFALRLYDAAPQGQHSALIDFGAGWLVAHQNEDGGWGDTVRSPSNISTTALCWAALGAMEGHDATRRAETRAGDWLTRSAGSLAPAALAEAIALRYGDDRTFSVPILTMCAIAGRLGAPADAWRRVPQLPFELASLPRSWFRFARLPVVSYALPALIAIGRVRHRLGRPRRPLYPLRWLARRRTMRVLQRIQPPGGGFLEATPLTSFVVMSLVAAGDASHPVVTAGVDFLRRSVRADGSWPIDTNLATWVTTLSVNALASAGELESTLSPAERGAIRDWLLGQQYRARHLYTGADPGGWAWTDLPGGVPDADDTAGALIALHNLLDPGERADAALVESASAGIGWLLGIQNRDGGIPTFCRGWGRLPFDRSAAELTAHALHAWSVWRGRVDLRLARRIDRAVPRALASLRRQQRPDGAWTPLWFGNAAAPDEENPVYGTSRVLLGLCAAGTSAQPSLAPTVERAARWLLATQNRDGGWGGAAGVASSVEETAQAVQALSALERRGAFPDARDAVVLGARWIADATAAGSTFRPAPIGLYFAKLWYFERLYPVIATVAALGAAVATSEDSIAPPGGSTN